MSYYLKGDLLSHFIVEARPYASERSGAGGCASALNYSVFINSMALNLQTQTIGFSQ